MRHFTNGGGVYRGQFRDITSCHTFTKKERRRPYQERSKKRIAPLQPSHQALSHSDLIDL